MSAETLRQAATEIRRDQDIEENLGHIGEREFATWLAVAAWLDLVAEDIEYDDSPAYINAATTVARTYLGDTP